MGILSSMIDLDFFQWKNECICVYIQKFNFTLLHILCSYYIVILFHVIFNLLPDLWDVMWRHMTSKCRHITSKCCLMTSFFQNLIPKLLLLISAILVIFGGSFALLTREVYLCCFLISICSVTILQFTN